MKKNTIALGFAIAVMGSSAFAEDGRENLIPYVSKLECKSVSGNVSTSRIETLARKQNAEGLTETLSMVYHNAKGSDISKGEHLEFLSTQMFHLEADTIELLGKTAKGEIIRIIVDEREEATDAEGFCFGEIEINGKPQPFAKLVCRVTRE
jgi:hypothetical protein